MYIYYIILYTHMSIDEICHICAMYNASGDNSVV